MDGYFSNAGAYVIEAIFGLYILVVMLRFVMQLVRADFYNPLSQFIVKATNPLLNPLRRIIPGIAGIDMASVVLLLGLQMAKLTLIALTAGVVLSLTGIFVLAIADLFALLLNLYMISIFAQIILSWVGQGGHNPLTGILYAINEPVMRPARKILPAMSGIDLSPILVFLSIGLLKILIVAPLTDLGRSLA